MARLQKWASGWNSPKLPGMVFSSKKLLMAAIDTDYVENEINPLLDKNQVEEVINEFYTYQILGIPKEFGEWFLRYEEEPDPRGGSDDIGTWSAIQVSDDHDGDIWTSTYNAKDAYYWVMKNYKNPDPEQQAGPQKIQEPECKCESLMYGHEPDCPFYKKLPMVGAEKRRCKKPTRT
jgi:hypothetical protein